MPKQTQPADVANIFVRFVLTHVGSKFNGLTNATWQATLDRFNNCCAYTGEPLAATGYDKDHAVPLNRKHGGLHVYGNVVPASKLANSQKKGLRYDEFLRSEPGKYSCLDHLDVGQREVAIERIVCFMIETRKDGLLAAPPELLALYQDGYEQVKSLCAKTIEQVDVLLEKLHLAESSDEIQAEGDDNDTLDLASDEQMEMEEQAASALPPEYVELLAQNSQQKIGVLARAIFEKLFNDGSGIIEKHLDVLQHDKKSFKQIGLSFPVLVKNPGDNSKRYYEIPYKFKGSEYYLCSQWYNDRRGKLEDWLTDTIFRNQSAA